MSLNASCSTCTEENDSSKEPVVGHEPADAATTQPFVPPSLTAQKPGLLIEFCTRCRWLHRATWTLTEVLLTFPPPTLASATLVPLDSTETGGRFRVWLALSDDETVLVWDRKTEGDFPVLKVLKQRIRDHIEPGRSLGHSDKK